MARRVLFAEVPCFYAMVERADDPALARRPVIVGGDPRKRGLVQSASPDALAAGVALDMPVGEALRLCPRARAVRTDVRRYREVGRRLLACLRTGFPRLEPFGLGAAWAELAPADPDPEPALAEVARRVRAELGLELRAGIAAGKFLARLAAAEAGEGGLRRIGPGDEAAFLRPLPLTRLEGVGHKTASVLAELGARSIGDVAALGRDRLQRALGSHGLRIFALACGQDDAPVRAASHPKSLSREATVRQASLDLGVLSDHLRELGRELESELRAQGLRAGRLTLKLRYGDQSRASRSLALGGPGRGPGALHEAALELLARTQAGSQPVRALGLQLGRLERAAEGDRQLELFPPPR
jgi:nucleotidyltransferase/DNA polymerase involved in DNA repair